MGTLGNDTLALTCELIRRRSITPADDGCQTLIADRLAAIGFAVEHLPFGAVSNLWARRGTAGPVVCFAGHTDVVPTGPVDQWDSDPFEPAIRDGRVYGRGAADMKGALAAMLYAAEHFITAYPDHPGSLAFLITSDEEGAAVNGTRRVMETLAARGETIDYCVVGEPSSARRAGDAVRVGRRGSLHGKLRVLGVQGHVAYPDSAVNPIQRFAPALTDLGATEWDSGSESFPPTTLQFSNIAAGTGADNVIPGELEALFNFRFSTAVTTAQLQERVEQILDRHGLRYTLDWRLGGHPFLTGHGVLVEAVRAAIAEATGFDTELSTAGGTSDGRFIAPTGAEVVEVGVANGTIHKINEYVTVTDLDNIAAVYLAILKRLLATAT